jgi:hypothetical protein
MRRSCSRCCSRRQLRQVPRPRPYSPDGFVAPQRLQRRSAGTGFGVGPGRRPGSWPFSGPLTAVSAVSPRLGEAPFRCSRTSSTTTWRTSSETGPRSPSRTSASSVDAGAGTSLSLRAFLAGSSAAGRSPSELRPAHRSCNYRVVFIPDCLSGDSTLAQATQLDLAPETRFRRRHEG